jgi:Flp pilus assembly protein TadG
MRLNHSKNLKHTQGVAAIEFALVLILLLMILAAAIEFGRVFWYYTALTKATRDGARQMSVLDSFADIVDVRTVVLGEANAARVAQDGAVSVLTSANINMECLNTDFTVVACSDDEPPAHVRVSISGFNVALGGWIPLLSNTGESDGFGVVTLNPQTTMTYMP